jgi:hypothetical protein
MGNASAHLQIRLDTPISSQRIAGVVFLKVDADKYDCDELRLQVRGSEITAVRFRTQTQPSKPSVYAPQQNFARPQYNHGHSAQRHVETRQQPVSKQVTANEEYHFLQTDCILTNFQGAARKGEYEFPFQVNLPPGLPASINTQHFKTAYCVQARLHREGWTTWDVVSPEYPLYQVGMQQSSDGLQLPAMLIPRGDPVYYCCCFGTGTMYTGGAVSNIHVAPLTAVKYTYAIDNQSTTFAKEMVIRLVETVRYQARGHGGARTRTVAEQRVGLSPARGPAPTAKAPRSAEHTQSVTN